jgi:hypothetical protein
VKKMLAVSVPMTALAVGLISHTSFTTSIEGPGLADAWNSPAVVN